jgi:hypothetical protein
LTWFVYEISVALRAAYNRNTDGLLEPLAEYAAVSTTSPARGSIPFFFVSYQGSALVSKEAGDGDVDESGITNAAFQ